MWTEMQIEALSGLLNSQLNFKRLYEALYVFLQSRHPRTSFPFALNHEEVLKIFDLDSPLGRKLSGVLKNTEGPQTEISLKILRVYSTSTG